MSGIVAAEGMVDAFPERRHSVLVDLCHTKVSKAEYQEPMLARKATSTIGLDVTNPMPHHSLADGGGHSTESRQTLVPLSFKVTKSFKKRYQQAALDGDMKLNELLRAMFDLWGKSRNSTQ